ncbi:MAG TPA: hypothetical protein VK915_03555 [Gaiellaceae bacterium]|nr:hypothetical protein [Gaiellaceae bacterium]
MEPEDVVDRLGRMLELTDHGEESIKRLPEPAVPLVRAIDWPCGVRERSRLRRLRRCC